MKSGVQFALAGRPTRRQALVTAGTLLLASATLGTPASAAVGDQNSWRFCEKCFTMFWDGGSFKGICKAGGTHTAQGYQFFPHFDDARPATSTMQYDWRYCKFCGSMFYNGAGPAGPCPSAGFHNADGYNFGLQHDTPAPPSSQTEWRYCKNCYMLFWNGASSKGRCPSLGATGHVASGFVFNIPFDHPFVAAAAATAAPPPPPNLPTVLAFDNNSITFENGVAVGGNSHVKLYQDGRVEFKSHFHDSGAPDYYYSITWAIIASDGTVFRFHHRDKVTGHVFGSGQSDRNSDFDQTATNAAVAQHWAALARANTYKMSAHTAASFGGLIDTAKEALADVEKVANASGTAFQTVSTIVDVFV